MNLALIKDGDKGDEKESGTAFMRADFDFLRMPAFPLQGRRIRKLYPAHAGRYRCQYPDCKSDHPHADFGNELQL